MKQISLLLLAITFAGLFTTGCSNNNTAPATTAKDSTTTFDLAAAKKIIEDKNTQFTKAHITGDTAYLNNIVTQDAKCFPPNSDIVSGRTAIAALNVQWINYGIKEFTETTIDFFGSQDFLVDEGTYYARYGKDNTTEKGKYINIWKKEGGDWKIYSNMWNTNTHDAPAK